MSGFLQPESDNAVPFLEPDVQTNDETMDSGTNAGGFLEPETDVRQTADDPKEEEEEDQEEEATAKEEEEDQEKEAKEGGEEEVKEEDPEVEGGDVEDPWKLLDATAVGRMDRPQDRLGQNFRLVPQSILL